MADDTARILVGALALLGALAGPAGAAPPAALAPEQAFRASAAVEGGDLVVRYRIAPGHYLYRGKFRLEVSPPGITAGKPRLPPGRVHVDEFFGRVETYRDQVELRVSLRGRRLPASGLSVLATSQGCADAGICYPPRAEHLIPGADVPRESPVPGGAGASSLLEHLRDEPGPPAVPARQP